jgi:hypothetical protein
MKFTALAVVIEDSQEEEAIKVAKEAGAGAVTILHGRNIGLEEKKIFFGLTLEENVSLLLFVLPRRLSMRVLTKLRKELNIDAEESNGFAFTMPLSHVAGLNVKELHKFEDDIKYLL